ncbi:hypothetical protein SH668x_001200 [Planctomicrobium sp. SH668]|uniref:hypothetical protein n=1 Tax=Planctomicrobium sp. SH668 TaxID=3448126 RepID=UPI003F5C4A4B
MSQLEEQLRERIDALVAQSAIVDQTQQEARLAKEELTRKRKCYEEAQENLNRIVRDITGLESGQPFLPFAGHPDTMRGTPALNKVGELYAKAEQNKTLSVKANLSILQMYGVSDSVISALMDADQKLVTVSDLCNLMQTDPQWAKKVKGLGEKKRLKVEEAVQQLLNDGAAKNDADKEEHDNRLKKCLKCESFRDAEISNCPTCNETTFTLENPPSDSAGESTFDPDLVGSRSVPMESDDVAVAIHTCQNPETGLWHGSFSVVKDGELIVGRRIPLHTSEPEESESLAIESAASAASVRLMEMEMDSASSSVRDFLHTVSADSSEDDDSEDEPQFEEAEEEHPVVN